jgi:hypothetical protein
MPNEQATNAATRHERTLGFAFTSASSADPVRKQAAKLALLSFRRSVFLLDPFLHQRQAEGHERVLNGNGAR